MNTRPLSLEEAQQQILAEVKPLAEESVNLLEAHGRILAETVTADTDVPAFPKAMLDGFAVRAADVQGASASHPVRLRVLETVPAGIIPTHEVGPGTATRIMTGAMMPPGADAVCRFEMTRDPAAADRTVVDVLAPVPVGEAVARVGEDVVCGTAVLAPGHRLGPAEVGMLATFGYAKVAVFRSPRVGILSSGTELVGVDEPLDPGKIRNSNSYMVASLVRAAGGVPRLYEPVSDDLEALSDTIRRALAEVDLLVTTGGVSVGDYDLMHEAFELAGARKRFWKVAVRPGSPVLFAVAGHVPVIGMSGNPAAAFVNAELFLLPAIRQMAGLKQVHRSAHTATLTDTPTKKMIKPTRFLRGFAYEEGGRLWVDVTGSQSSGVFSSFLHSNALVRIEGGKLPQAGDAIEVYLYGRIGASNTPHNPLGYLS
jgi:molybdopterin molybdotransferase